MAVGARAMPDETLLPGGTGRGAPGGGEVMRRIGKPRTLAIPFSCILLTGFLCLQAGADVERSKTGMAGTSGAVRIAAAGQGQGGENLPGAGEALSGTRPYDAPAGRGERSGEIVATSGKAKRASIRGRITRITKRDTAGGMAGIWGTILVEGTRGAEGRSSKASVKIDSGTRVLSQEAQGLTPRKPDDLKVGQTVEVTFSGPVAMSYPAKAKAGKIVIISSHP